MFQDKSRPENRGLITIGNAFPATVSRISLSRRLCRFRCCCTTSTKKSRGAIPAFSGRLVQSREVSQAAKATSLVGMASLFDLDGLVGKHRVHAFEPPVQHRPSTRGTLSIIAIFRQLTCALFVKKGCPVLLRHVLTRRRGNFGDVLWPKTDVIAFSQVEIFRSAGIAV